MPPAPKSKMKEPTLKVVHGFNTLPNSPWPYWDDNQIQHEVWGASLAAVDPATSTLLAMIAPATKEQKVGKGSGRDMGFHQDVEGRSSLESFLEARLTAAAGIQLPSPRSPDAAVMSTTARASDEEAGAATLPLAVSLPKVSWQRPKTIVKPFRPIVHRNATPFLDPYAEELQMIDAKAEEARFRAESIPQTGPGMKKGEAKEMPTGPHHTLYPETVSLLEDLVGQSVATWKRLDRDEVIKTYRALTPLMEPYNPTLVAGCAETPAEACGSRYSTALRHKLRQVEELAALKHIPPFVMGAFNSVLRVVEHSQHLVPPGGYLWELVYPHAPGTCHPVYNPFGKYAVKLYIDGAYRKIVVDDALPVDELGRPLITVTSRKELWPALIVKALFKALGPTAQYALCEDPEVLLSCLMGNGAAQYMNLRSEPVATIALLLTYRLQLSSNLKGHSINRLKAKNLRTAREVCGRTSVSNSLPSSAMKRSSSVASSVTHARSVDGKKKKGEKKPEEPELDRLTAEEICPPSTDEPVDPKPMIVCGLRTGYSGYPTPSGEPSSEYATQLYTIEDIVPFRNTLAVKLVTTPRTDLVPGIFCEEIDAPDVRDVLSRSTMQMKTAADDELAATLTSVWLTCEELVNELDSLVCWRPFDRRYLRQVTMDCEVATTVVTPPIGNTKVRGPPPAAPAAVHGLLSVKKNSVMWISLTCETPEEVAVVVTSPHPTALQNPNDLSATLPEVKTVPNKKAPLAKKVPPKRGAGASNKEETSVKVPTPPPEMVDTPDATGHRTSVPWGEVDHEGKLVQLDYYQWNRTEPLTQSSVITYESGKVSCSMLRLRPGTHIFRVTVPEMETYEKITFLSDAKIEIKSELKDLTRAVNIYSVSDAGYYRPINNAQEESVWFKRRIRVSEPTHMTAVLSTLLPTEDPAAHRVPLVAAVPVKGAGKGNSSVTTRVNNSKALPSTNPREEEGLEPGIPRIPIQRYTKLVLINLDDNAQQWVGEAGQLAYLHVAPNKLGYMLLGYAKVPQQDEAILREAYTQSYKEATGELPLVERLYGKGLWKLEVRCDRELSAFETTAHAGQILKDTGRLERGGPTTLLCRTCTVVEPTHISMIVNMKDHFNIPVMVRVLRRHEPEVTAVPPPQMPIKSAKEPIHPNPAEEVPPVLSEDTVYYKTPLRMQHIFISDVLLEVSEKGKPVTYFLEVSVDADAATSWDETCRQAQEHMFMEQSKESEMLAQESLRQELSAYQENPAQFLSQKREAYLQQQLANAELVDRVARGSSTSVVGQGGRTRRRSQSQEKRKGGPANGRGSNVRTLPTVDRSSLVNTPSPASCATVDEFVTDDLVVAYTSKLLLSSTRADVKNASPPMDPIAALREHWQHISFKEDGATDRPISSAAPPRSNVAGGSSVKANKQQQRDQAVAAAEVFYRQEQARQARQRFLENPKNVLMPYCSVEESAGTRSHSPRGPSTLASAAPPQLFLEDSEENNYRHQPPLEEAMYSVKLLPIRCVEVCPAVLVDGATFSSSKESRRSGRGGTAAKSSSALTSSTANAGVPASSGILAEEADLVAMREPMVRFSATVAEAASAQREDVKRCRAYTRSSMKDSWRVWHMARAETVVTGAGPGATPPQPGSSAVFGLPHSLVLSSIIGSKEEDATFRPRKSLAI